MGSSLAYYKILFVIEILIAEFLFSFNLKKRNNFLLRYIIGVIVVLVIAFLFPTLGGDALLSSLMFFILFIITIVFMIVCVDEDIVNILFCALAAYTMQHLAYEISNLVLSLVVDGQSPLLGLYGSDALDFSNFNEYTILYILIYLLCYFTVYSLIYTFFGKHIKKGKPMKIKSITMLVFVGLGLVVNIVLNSIAVYGTNVDGDNLIDYIYNIMCGMLLLYSQFSLLSNKELQSELDIVQHLLHQKEEQFSIINDNMDLINRKCHDMKHQIRQIGENNCISDEAIKEIQESISLYDAVVKTGNETLDIILTEKSFICRGNNILLSYIVDGVKLNFIKETDLFSLFGNALDNAIEAVMKIEDTKNRIIGIKIRTQGEMISINISNTFKGDIYINEEGLPMTTKEDKDYHGYGLKSIMYIVSSYDGNLSFTIRENVFNLNILIPIKTAV